MGNFLSCTLVKVPGAKGAKVIMPDGGVRPVELPATAAELMMDAPGHFLADARAARVGARLAALSADEELELGAVYATFPMKRLGTPLAAADVARLVAAAATREARCSARVAAVVSAPPQAEASSVVAVADGAPRLRLDEMVDDAAAADMSVFKHRLSRVRSRRPTLETIQEENFLARS
ncbi:hypothetical protein GUJ93_ZPchr0010g7534 [Zizania palustris]|uniref:Uncharacterized protein n=1 Tax=Zizania palustris TaxID=103762 RepID=A0A8J6BFP2_ZIZPA|nr:hypothetical protein GUJ93_ZPchr0010g7534 [Zizania palustris]